MRKRKTRLISIMFAAVFCGSALFGCFGCKPFFPPDPPDPPDPTKSQLLVHNYNGGIGTGWLDKAKLAFEEKFKDFCFEPGVYVEGVEKKGVQIQIDADKQTPSPASSSYNVFFQQQTSYNDLISKKEIMDISDIVTGSLSGISDGAETGTIENKLNESQRKALTAVGQGKYYALPHYAGYYGLTYDKDVFNIKELYFAEGGGWTGDGGAQKTVGPDGVRGTYDDGLPSSYEEFYLMMQQMRNMSVTPFTWTGTYANIYTNILLLGLWAAYGGESEFMLNVNFGTGEGQGVQTEIITELTGTNLFAAAELKGKVPVLSNRTMTAADGYLMTQQAGVYYALTMLETIMATPANYSSRITAALSHLDAQEDFIRGPLEGKPIGMLIDGNYWYNEASEAFKRAINTYKEDAENRNFAWMPLPSKIKGKVTEGETVKKNTIIDGLSSFAYINANISDANIAKLAKTFLQFLYTDEQLAEFTMSNGMMKGVNYTIPADKLNGMNSFYRSVYETARASDIAYPYSEHPIFVNAQTAFNLSLNTPFFNSTVSGLPYSSPYTAFQKGISADAYFKGMWKSKGSWDALYKQYY